MPAVAGCRRTTISCSALDDGTLKEASLDVFEVEPLPKTSRALDHPRVFVTPHAAATSDPDYLVGADACPDGRP